MSLGLHAMARATQWACGAGDWCETLMLITQDVGGMERAVALEKAQEYVLGLHCCWHTCSRSGWRTVMTKQWMATSLWDGW